MTAARASETANSFVRRLPFRAFTKHLAACLNAIPGALITSRDGKLAVRLTEFDGSYPIPGRDATGFWLNVLLEPNGTQSRLAVLFSGTSIASEWRWFDLPDIAEDDRRLLYFAEAAIGEYLDTKGLPPQRKRLAGSSDRVLLDNLRHVARPGPRQRRGDRSLRGRKDLLELEV